MTFGHPGQDGVPGQRRGGCKGLAAALALLAAGAVDHRQQLLAFGLPVAQLPGQQRPRQDDTPIAALLADADIDELRGQHDLAEAFLYRFHRGLSVLGTIEGDGLDTDHRVVGLCQRRAQIHAAGSWQHQTGIADQWRQLKGHLFIAFLRLTAVAVDRIDQLRRLIGQGYASERQGQRQAGQTQNG
ncbi:hypothetical protein D3C80_1013110 [compost metagenome]